MARREVPAFGDWVLEGGKPLRNEIEHSLGDFVRQCLEQLDQLDRDLLLMYYHERRTYREIGEMLSALWDREYDRRHAFYYVARARNRLRDLMDREASGLNYRSREQYERLSA